MNKDDMSRDINKEQIEQELRKTVTEASAKKAAKRKPWFASRGLRLVAGFVIVIFMFTGLFAGLSYLGLFTKPALAGEISITALQADKQGIDPATAFLIRADAPLTEKAVRDNLKITPSFAYELQREKGGKEYKIIPRETLAANTVYTFSLDVSGKNRESFSWAFQTKGPFQVLRTLPGDKTTGVPVNTGIEITFSHEGIDPNKAKEYVSIAPQTAGRYEMHKKTLVFIPQDLQPGTLYTLTVKKGLPLPGSDLTLNEDYTFSFETALQENPTDFRFDFDTRLMEFSTREAPTFATYFFTEKRPLPKVTVDLYRYADSAAFRASLAKRDVIPSWSYNLLNRYHEDLSGMPKFSRYQLEFINADDNTHYMALPQAIPAGYYAAEITAENTTRQIWFQVTDLAVYQAASDQGALFWVNDLATGQTVPGVKVSVESKNLIATGDENGVAVLNQSPLSGKRDYALIQSGGREILAPLEVMENGIPNDWLKARDYWKYLYLDRELFKPGDTLHFWGVVAPRPGANQEVKNVTIELMGTDGPLYDGAENTPILTSQIALNGTTFTGEMALPVLKPGYYYLNVKVGEVKLLSRGFSVQIYDKAAYRLTLAPEKRAVFAGDKTSFEAKAAFFEGTPLPGLGLNYQIDGKSGNVTTGREGTALIPYIAQPEGDALLPWSYSYLGVTAGLPESGEIGESAGIYVFRSQVNVDGEASRNGDAFGLKARVNKIDLRQINAGAYPGDSTNYLREPVANSRIKGSLYQEIWEKIESGNRYDYITKRVEKNYYYKYSTKHISDFDITTGADGEAQFSGQLEPGGSYYLQITAKDSAGRETGKRVTIPGGTHPEREQYKYYYLKGGQEQGYAPGEKAAVSMMENETVVAPRDKGFLYFRAQKRISGYTVENSSQYGFTFQNEDIPGVYVYGVYFDGASYHEANSCLINFARDSKALHVQMKADKELYRPGEKVKVSVQVTDRNNNPVIAQINLNLVDEALYALENQDANLLGSLYGDYIYPYLITRVSHFHPDRGGGAERGGEGGGERKDFRDTVLFTTLETDRAGLASAEFTLPDNLTSWRVTYHALTADLLAASGNSQIPVRLPYFVEMTANNTALEGDYPVVVLRSYGEKIKTGDSISYHMKLTDPDGAIVTETAHGEAFTALDWALPPLKAGRYTLIVEGTCGGYQDILTKELNVVKSYLERTITNQQLLTENLQIAGSAAEPTTLIFSDYEKGQSLKGLYQLARVDGSRVEQQLAAAIARRLLNEYFPGNFPYFRNTEEQSIQRFQKPDGGIAILPYGESDLALSAIAASLNSGDFDKTSLARYFFGILEKEQTGEDDRSLALWGLAALKEPVLIQLNDKLQEKDLAPAEKIRLSMACADVGNGAVGLATYKELLAQYGEDLGTTIRINVGRDQDELIEATTQMALLAAKLDQPEKNKLYQYILENKGTEILNNLEQVQILQYNLRYMNPNPVSFTYELNGQKVSKSLQGKETYQLTLLPGDLDKIKFSQIQGQVGVLTTYTRPYSASDIKPEGSLSINRSYLVQGKKTITLRRTDLVQVVLTYDIGDKAPAGHYEIVDILPAGLKYVNRPYLYNQKQVRDLGYPSEVKGQKLTFPAYKGQGKLVYYARVASPGEFTAQSTLLSHLKNAQICILGSQERILIK